jgi:nucleotide-binding universal stress UspA family protein
MKGDAMLSRLLVGVDFDEASAAALKMAAVLVARFEAELTVFHAAAAAVPAYFTTSQIGQLEAERAQGHATIAGQLRDFVARQHAGTVNVAIGEGPPQEAILRIAPAFDLVAVGTHRRHGAARWWLGSVAEAIVRQSPRPVLVVPGGAGLPRPQGPPTILAAGGDAAAIGAWADLVSAALGGRVDQSPDLRQCAPDRVEHADVIVLPRPAGASHPQWGEVAHVLKACPHPLLFVPVAEIVERSSS